MQAILIIFKYILFAIAIMYTSSTIIKAFRGQSISSKQLFITAFSIAGYFMFEYGFNV